MHIVMDNDIYCLTETQLETSDDTLPIESALQRQYRMHFNTYANKFKSVAYDYSNQTAILSNENFNAISIFTLRKQQFSNTPISIALIYRSLNSPISVFIDCLQHLVGRNTDIFF